MVLFFHLSIFISSLSVPKRKTMSSIPRLAARVIRPSRHSAVSSVRLRTFAGSSPRCNRSQLEDPPKGNPTVADRGPPEPPREEAVSLKDNIDSATFLGTTKRLPEFALNDRVVLVTGAARGLGLVQAEALCEAGATGEL